AERLSKAVEARIDDKAGRVRFQAALTLGAIPGASTTKALAKLAARSDNDSWTQTAILIAAAGRGGDVLRDLPASAPPAMRSPLAAPLGAGGDEKQIARLLALIGGDAPDAVRLALLEGLAQGLAQSGKSLTPLWDTPAAAPARKLFDGAARTAADSKKPAS